jgi:stage II sporulation protein D
VLVDGTSYPGSIRIVPRGTRSAPLARQPGIGRAILASPEPEGRQQPSTPARLDVVETVPMEAYLAGVIGAEMLPQWSLGAYQVAAVCGRTYALHERERARKLGRDYDLEATTADQAYNGGARLPVAEQAVKDTRGVVVTWQGRLLRTYYSSTCGGRTASAADIWPTGPGYEFNLDLPIQAQHRETMCQGSPRYRWDPVRDRAELSRRIREWGKANGHSIAGVGLLSVVRVTRTNKDERPSVYEVEDDRHRRFSIECEELRKACQQTVAGLPPIPKEQTVWSSDFEFEVKGPSVVIHGRGFGHGVGMCQYCTEAFSRRGDPWREIVLRYYPGAKLERAY